MTLVLLLLVVVVALVAVDALGRLDERRACKRPPEPAATTTSEKIVVDLSNRDRD